MLISRLVANGDIDDSGRDLAICGGGVGGIAAAVAAAAKSIGVTVYERESSLFSRQRRSARWISPYFYEWPAPEFEQRLFPVWGMNSLGYAEGASSLAARVWSQARKAARAASGTLNIEAPAEVIDIVPDPLKEAVDLTFRKAGLTKTHRVSVLVVAASERPRAIAGPFAGANYWSRQTPAVVVASIGARSVAVSGGGDGALQDLVAIATARDDARSVLEDIRSANRSVFDVAIGDALKVENQWRRSTALGNPALDCAEHRVLDRWASGVASALWAEPNIRDIVLALCQASPTITLVHTCNHFSPLYGINRLLAHLVSRALRETNRLIVHDGRRTTNVSSASLGHICDPKDAMACVNSRHELLAASQMLCGGPIGTADISLGAFDLVVAHHFEADSSIADALPRRAFAARQLLPMHLQQP